MEIKEVDEIVKGEYLDWQKERVKDGALDDRNI